MKQKSSLHKSPANRFVPSSDLSTSHDLAGTLSFYQSHSIDIARYARMRDNEADLLVPKSS